MLFRTTFALGILLAGCSSSGGTYPPDAMIPTGTTTGGMGGRSSGTDPASQGALSLYLSPSSAPGNVCPAGSHWINVPFAAQGSDQTTASTKGSTAVDGKDENAVTCAVRARSDGFAVTASLRSPAFDAMNNPVQPTAVTLSTLILAGQSAPGTLAVQDSKTGVPYASASEAGQAGATCTFSVQPAQPGDQLDVTAGRIWASVVCPRFRDVASSSLNETCAITQGYVVLENCAQ